MITKKGYELPEVVSLLQKSIRRGDTSLAGWAALEMFDSGFYKYVWRRLLTISAEDCAGLITTEVKALYDSFMIANEGKKVVRSRIFISKAVIVMCRSVKCRDADHLQNYVYDKDLIDEDELEATLDEIREQKPEIPEYVFDVHTKKGRIRGKNKKDFFLEEQACLDPKDPNSEFDELVGSDKPTRTSRRRKKTKRALKKEQEEAEQGEMNFDHTEETEAKQKRTRTRTRSRTRKPE